MRYKPHQYNLEKKLTLAISRSILSISIPPSLYFMLLFICYMQTIRSLTSNQSVFHILIKWFDPATLLPPEILLYAAVAPVLLVSLGVVVQVVWVGEDSL
jgi:hypothetical protein